MKTTFSFFCRLLPVLLTLSTFSFAALFADIPQRKVTVMGTSIIKVVPNQMLWNVQIRIDDATLAKGKSRHDESLADTLKFLKSFGSTLTDLQTGGIRFEKRLYPADDPAVKQRPFSCSTQVTFTLTDLEKYGSIVDGLAKLDGVQVQSIDYAYANEATVRRDALKQALLNAHDKANDLAVEAGCYIDKPLEIIEGDTNFHPLPGMRNMALAAQSNGGTPDAVVGQIEISASVTVTYDLYYR